MKPIRVGMAGYGLRGPALVDTCKRVDGLEPTAVCATSEATGRKVAADHPGLSFFTDYSEMLDSGHVDAVVIEAPPAVHAPFAIQALEKNIHVLSDVPALHALEEVEGLWKAVQNSKAVYQFGATTNYYGFVGTCSDLKDKGLLGEPYYLEVEYVHDIRELCDQTPWRKGYEPIRYCTHSLGPALKWLGDELVSVSCFDTGSHVEPGADNHDAMVAIFRTSSNAVVKLLISFVNCLPHGCHRYVYHGTAGYFESTWPLTGGDPEVSFSTKGVYGMDKLTRLPVSEKRPELAHLSDLQGHGTADYAMLADFAAAMNGAPCTIGLKEGLEMTLPGLVALESARQKGKVLDIAYPWTREHDRSEDLT